MDKKYFCDKVQKVGVVGAGVSGLSIAIFLKQKGKAIKVTDNSTFVPEDKKEKLEKTGAELEFGEHASSFLKDTDLIVFSPGVDAEEFKRNYLKGLAIPCVGEVEFAYWFCESDNIIGITGTNGKTTTTYLIGEILKKHTRKKVYVVGNIGVPFSSVVDRVNKDDIIVIELSSFQLEMMFSFRPRIACMLNLSEDHLDRYPSTGEYFKAKKRIFLNQDSSCYAFFPRELEDGLSGVRAIRCYIEGDNSRSAVKKIVELYGVGESKVDVFYRSFKGLPHRLEYVGSKNNIEFVNDSKSTTVSSTVYALKKTKLPIVLIAGGKDKGLDYTGIKIFLDKVEKIILIGQAKGKIKESLDGCIDIVEKNTLKAAVNYVYNLDGFKGTVLFSPMCSSFDMFDNYKERGKVFKKAVRELSS